MDVAAVYSKRQAGARAKMRCFSTEMNDAAYRYGDSRGGIRGIAAR